MGNAVRDKDSQVRYLKDRLNMFVHVLDLWSLKTQI